MGNRPTGLIEGVNVHPLTAQISGSGIVLPIQFQRTHPAFMEYRLCDAGVARAWWESEAEPIFVAIVEGRFRFALFDARSAAKTYGAIWELFAGGVQPVQIEAPTGVLWGWKALGGQPGRLLIGSEKPLKLRQAYPADTQLIPYQW